MSLDATDERPRALALIVVSCCLAAMGEGFDLQAPGVTLPVLGPLFHLTSGQGQGFLAGFLSAKSLFLSMSTFGLIIGAVVGGRLSDRFGRKWVAVVSVLLFAIGSAWTGQAHGVDDLLWRRFLTGLGLGGAMPNLIAIVAETVSSARRSTAIGLLYGSLPAGGALASLATYAFSRPEQWPMIYYLGALAPLVSLPGLIWAAPGARPMRTEGDDRGHTVRALFGEGRAGTTLALWAAFFLALITMYVLLSWLPSLLVARGLPRPQASVVQVGFNVFGFLGSVLTGLLIDRAGRKAKIAVVFAASIISLAILAAAPASPVVSFVVGSLVGMTISGVQTVLYALAPACYPRRARGIGVGSAVSAGRIGSAVGPFLAGSFLGAGASAGRVLALLIPLVLVSGLLSMALSPRAREGDGATA